MSRSGQRASQGELVSDFAFDLIVALVVNRSPERKAASSRRTPKGNAMNSEILLSFLDSRRQPLTSEQEAQQLNELCAASPLLARQALTDPCAHVSRKAQLLAGLLGTSLERGEIEAALRA